MDYQTKWLSKTPDVPGSKDWDASQTRIATFLTLYDLSSSTSSISSSPGMLHFINTHYDDQGRKSREHASWIIREEALKWIKKQSKHDVPLDGKQDDESLVIWMGDFNADPVEKKEKGYRAAVSKSPLPSSLPGLYFLNSHNELLTRNKKDTSKQPDIGIRQSAPYGPKGTYTGFTRPGCEDDQEIDFILLASTQEDDEKKSAAHNDDETERENKEEPIKFPVRGSWTVTRHVTVDNVIPGKGDVSGWIGRWSDHRAVMVELVQEV